jgi:hypothetical protein
MANENVLDRYDVSPSTLNFDEHGGNPLDAYDTPTTEKRAETAPVATPPPKELKWADVPGEAVKHLVPSAKATALGMVEPLLHPVESVKTIGNIGAGLLSKGAGVLGYAQPPAQKAANEETVDAIGQFYKNRYGTEEGFKRAIAEDPVGVMSDFSAFVGGGGSALARAPGMVGKVGAAAETAGRAIHPISVAATAASPAIWGAQKALNFPLSIKTGAPREALDTALKAGWEGSDAFKRHLSGEADPAEIVDRAHSAVGTLSDKRRSDYLASMAGMRANQSPVNYAPINRELMTAFRDVQHGSKVYRPEAMDMLLKLSKEIVDWQHTPNAPGVNYHNLEGVDKLKQLVGKLRAGVRPGSPADAMATRVYNSIKNTLAKHDPNYLKAIGDYAEASDLLKQMKNTLSINPKASVETTLRKLLLGQKQKDGSKGSLLKELKDIDPEIQHMIAGHLLSSKVPVGFSGGIGAALSLSPHVLQAMSSGAIDPTTAVLNVLSSSPNLIGHLNYGIGHLANPGKGLPIMATAPLNVLSYGRTAQPEAAPVEHPYFGDEDEKVARATRASGGRTVAPKPQTAQSLLAAVKRARKAIQSQTEAILAQPDEHVVRALSVANEKI